MRSTGACKLSARCVYTCFFLRERLALGSDVRDGNRIADLDLRNARLKRRTRTPIARLAAKPTADVHAGASGRMWDDDGVLLLRQRRTPMRCGSGAPLAVGLATNGRPSRARSRPFCQHQGPEPRQASSVFHQFIEERLRQGRQPPSRRCLGGDGTLFLHDRHIHDFYPARYAPPTKLQIGP